MWHQGAGAPANKSPVSKFISANRLKQPETGKLFLGHTAKQINKLFFFSAVLVAVAGISGKPFVLLW